MMLPKVEIARPTTTTQRTRSLPSYRAWPWPMANVVMGNNRFCTQVGDAVWYQGDLCTTPQEVYVALVGVEADPLLGDLEKDLLHQVAAQDPRFAELLTDPNRSREQSV
jgi:hypothetical protein